MKTLRQILNKGMVPKSDGDKAFVAQHKVQVTDPLDDKAAKGNDKWFKGATKPFDRAAHRMGYNNGQDVEAYDPQAKDDDAAVYNNDEWKGSRAVEEDVEQIDELSKNTLGSYIKKASYSAVVASKNVEMNKSDYEGHARFNDKLNMAKSRKSMDWHNREKNNRLNGINSAAERLAKEDVEPVNEVSRKTLSNYIKGAAHELRSGSFMQGVAMKDNRFDIIKNYNQVAKRHKGIQKAATKLAKEDVEQIDEISKSTLGSYIKKATRQAIDNSFDHGVNDELNRPLKARKFANKAWKREKGIQKAATKLAKEDVESVDEGVRLKAAGQAIKNISREAGAIPLSAAVGSALAGSSIHPATGAALSAGMATAFLAKHAYQDYKNIKSRMKREDTDMSQELDRTEVLLELSKKVLSNYIKKAARSNAEAVFNQEYKTHHKRLRGIDKASDKLAKEPAKKAKKSK